MDRDEIFRESRHCLIRSVIVTITILFTILFVGVGYVETKSTTRIHRQGAVRLAPHSMQMDRSTVEIVVSTVVSMERASRERDFRSLEARVSALASQLEAEKLHERESNALASQTQANEIQSLEARIKVLVAKPRASERKAASKWETYMDDKSAEHIAKNLATSLSRSGNMTVFILRIQKAGSSSLEHLFGMSPFDDADRKRLRRASPACVLFADCAASTLEVDVGLKVGSQECADRSHLMHYGHGQGDAHHIKKGRVFHGPLRRTNKIDAPMSDCIPFIYSYSFEERYRSHMSTMEKRVVNGYLSHARMVSGHFKYGVHALGHSGVYTYVTALRDPIRRVLSQWNWWCVRPNRKMVHKSTFTQWINHKMAHRDPTYGHYMLSNHMTRMICGRTLGKARPGVGGHPFESEVMGNSDVEPMTWAHLECAKQNLLKDFTLVIVLEMLREQPGLEEELRVMIAEMMLNIPPEWASEAEANANATPMDAAANQVKKSDLSITTVMKVQEQNTLDFELHDFGRQLFARQIEEWRRVYAMYREKSGESTKKKRA